MASAHISDQTNWTTDSLAASDTEDDSINDESVAEPLVLETTTQKATSRRTKSAARTNKAGLSLSTQKELAKDIEENHEGLKHFFVKRFSLAILCNSKPDIYGEPGSELRQQVRNKLKHWKHLSEDEYKEVLSNLGVWSANYTATQRNLLPRQDRQVAATLEPLRKSAPKTRKQTDQRDNIVDKTINRTRTMNELGKKIVLTLPNGLIFVAFWVDSKLQPSTLEFLVSRDGMGVTQRSKKPSPKNAKDMLAHYSWAKDSNNVVVTSMDAELKKLKQSSRGVIDHWTETDILVLDEEVVRCFVDINGATTNDIEYTSDSEGRQMITFFLKTLRAHEAVPSAATFKNSGKKKSSRDDGPTGMDIGIDSEEEKSFLEETLNGVEDVREEMEQHFQKMTNDIQDHSLTMRKEIREDMGAMLRSLMQQIQGGQNQQIPAKAAAPRHSGFVPDGVGSSPSY